MGCNKCGKVFIARQGSRYCSSDCEDLAVEDWKSNPWVRYHNIDIAIPTKKLNK